MRVPIKGITCLFFIIVIIISLHYILSKNNLNRKVFPEYSMTYSEFDEFTKLVGYKTLHNVYNAGGNLAIENGSRVLLGNCQVYFSSKPIVDLVLTVNKLNSNFDGTFEVQGTLNVSGNFLTDRSADSSLEIIVDTIRASHADVMECYKKIIEQRSLLD
jgi:hypothetical protein